MDINYFITKYKNFITLIHYKQDVFGLSLNLEAEYNVKSLISDFQVAFHTSSDQVVFCRYQFEVKY